MRQESNAKNTLFYIGILCLIVWMGFTIYYMATIPQFRWMVLPPVFFVPAMTFYAVYGDVFPWIRKPMFLITKSGVFGRIVSAKISLPGGKIMYWLSLNQGVVKNDVVESKKNVIRNAKNKITNTMLVPIVGYPHQFVKPDSRDVENPDGVMFFEGKIDGTELMDPAARSYLQEMNRMQSTITHMATIVAKFRGQLLNLANENILTTKQYASAVRAIADDAKIVNIITRGTGQNGGIDAVAGEMSG